MKQKILMVILILSLTGCTQPSINDQVQQSASTVVPFTSQAPFAEWDDPRQQDACEEASVLMAMLWVKQKTEISKEDAKNKMLDMVEYQDTTYDASKDTSARDTLKRLINEYYDYQNAQIKVIESSTDIIEEIQEGNLIIMPTDGKALNNPNFTNGGPDKHMLVIKDYDERKDKFITNDPGTRNGENYAYSSKIIINALKNYPTSNTAISVLNDKEVIVVSR